MCTYVFQYHQNLANDTKCNLLSANHFSKGSTQISQLGFTSNLGAWPCFYAHPYSC